jgi:hypothetical protein
MYAARSPHALLDDSEVAMPSPPSLSEDMAALIGAAIRAPSSHNTQPWRFRVTGSAIDLFADPARRLPVNDPDDRELTLSCGCALMNLRVAAGARGLRIEHEILPDPNDPHWLARVSLVGRKGAASPVAAGDTETDLAPYIPIRRTDRGAFASRAVPDGLLDRLVRGAATEGAWLRPLLTEDARLQTAALVADGDAALWADQAWRRELATWMRPRSRGDGLTLPSLAVPIARRVVRSLDLGRRVGVKDRALALSAPLLVVLGTDHDDPRHWLCAGQALQRVLLVAGAQGLQASYFNQPIQVPALRPRLRQVVGPGLPQMLVRLGEPLRPRPASLRRALGDVVELLP